MQDAHGNVKVGLTSGEVEFRTRSVHNQIPHERRPVRLVHALKMCPSIAGRVERAAHRRLCYAALPQLGQEWFSEKPQQCLRAVLIEADYFTAKEAPATKPARRGRPAFVLTDAQRAAGEALWRDVAAFPTWPDVEPELKKQISKRMTRWRAHREWGPRIGAKSERT